MVLLLTIFTPVFRPHIDGCPRTSLTSIRSFPAPGLHGKVVRDFLRDYGVKQRALEAGILQELSKEEAEADIIQRGALVGMALR